MPPAKWMWVREYEWAIVPPLRGFILHHSNPSGTSPSPGGAKQHSPPLQRWEHISKRRKPQRGGTCGRPTVPPLRGFILHHSNTAGTSPSPGGTKQHSPPLQRWEHISKRRKPRRG